MALAMMGSADVDASPIITHRFPFEHRAEAYGLQHLPTDGATKIVIDMP